MKTTLSLLPREDWPETSLVPSRVWLSESGRGRSKRRFFLFEEDSLFYLRERLAWGWVGVDGPYPRISEARLAISKEVGR